MDGVPNGEQEVPPNISGLETRVAVQIRVVISSL